MKRILKVAANWFSGTDETALSRTHVEKTGTGLDALYRYRFNEDGFLDDNNVPSPKASFDENVDLLVEHGYCFISSKELFIYSKKTVEVHTPDYSNGEGIPKHVLIALGSPRSADTVGSGVPGSGLFSIISLLDIPTYMTPMVITELTDNEALVINADELDVSTYFNESSNKELTVLSSRFTGLEETAADIYEVETIKDLNLSTDTLIVNPDRYVYDHLSNKVYLNGFIKRSAVEYEVSNVKEAILERNFRVSQIGRESGILNIGSEEDFLRAGGNLLQSGKRNIDLQGTQVFINQEATQSVVVEIRTIIYDSDGNEVPYRTLTNNLGYAHILAEAHPNVQLYLSNILIATTDDDGVAIIPILGYADEGIHGRYTVTGKKRIVLTVEESVKFDGELAIFVYDAQGIELIQEERFLVRNDFPVVSVGSTEDVVLYVSPGTEFVHIEDVILSRPLYINGVHNSWTNNEDPTEITAIGISYVNLKALTLIFPSVASGRYIKYPQLNFKVVTGEGGPGYGIG